MGKLERASGRGGERANGASGRRSPLIYTSPLTGRERRAITGARVRNDPATQRRPRPLARGGRAMGVATGRGVVWQMHLQITGGSWRSRRAGCSAEGFARKIAADLCAGYRRFARPGRRRSADRWRARLRAEFFPWTKADTPRGLFYYAASDFICFDSRSTGDCSTAAFDERHHKSAAVTGRAGTLLSPVVRSGSPECGL
jgi:hypothetical protein